MNGRVVITDCDLVIDACQELRDRGIQPGLSVKAAKALVSNATFVKKADLDFDQDRQFWLNRLAMFSDDIESDQPHRAWVDLSKHPEPQEALKELIVQLSSDLGRENYPGNIRFGVGRNRWISELSSQYDFDSRSYSAPDEYLRPVPITSLANLETYIQERLNFLGYHTCEEVQKVNLETLRKQFGNEALRISAAVRGHNLNDSSSGLRTNYPKHNFSAHFQFESPVSDWETLREGVRHCCSTLAFQLSKKHLIAHQVLIRVDLEDQPAVGLERYFNKPITTHLHLQRVLQLMLSDQNLKEVQRIEVKLIDLKLRHERQQSIEDNHRMVATQAIDQVRSAYGDRSVILAKEVPTPWNDLFLRHWMHSYGVN